ncbi:MAG: hypothetical protein SGPRY_007120 [Prymnesium sp.]
MTNSFGSCAVSPAEDREDARQHSMHRESRGVPYLALESAVGSSSAGHATSAFHSLRREPTAQSARAEVARARAYEDASAAAEDGAVQASTSQRLEKTEFLKVAWVEFGCPGLGKGPWDGLGAMIKTKVRRDLTNEQCLTPSGDIDNALDVVQHTRATLCIKSRCLRYAQVELLVHRLLTCAWARS